jgi:hypothetical protein
MTNDIEPAPGMPDDVHIDEQLVRAQFFICHERHIFHRYSVLRDSPVFPLLFTDRCYDWQFESTGDVPIISRYNGFMELVARESWAERDVVPDQLADEIRQALAAGSHMALPIALVHTDGTPYITEWLIEAIDDDDNVYYTKTSPDPSFRAFRKPVPFSKLMTCIAFSDDGLAPVTEIRASPTIERILSLDPLEAFRAVFREFGLREYDGRLSRYVTPVVVGVDGIDRLIENWEQREDEILSAGVILFNDQSRLNKHVQNRFIPVQYCLNYLVDEPKTRAVIGDGLAERVRQDVGRLDVALNDLLKFSSLLVQQPRKQNYDLYLKYLRRLRDTVADYQQTNVALQRALTR